MTSEGVVYILALFILLLSIFDLANSAGEITEDNPYNQKFPDCTKPYSTIQKKSNAKGVLCPMIKDEEGFLSEWVAYYEMHGFTRINLYDHGSTDNYRAELKPWLDSGVVRIYTNWTENEGHRKRQGFFQTIHLKRRAEAHCKRQAIADGYDYFFSIDIDEYLIPREPDLTLIDAFDKYVNKTSRYAVCSEKFNFQVSPHILEPVHLLTIEAYRLRMKTPGKMSYYTTVSKKCGLVLTHPFYKAYKLQNNESDIGQYLTECCNFHGCQAEKNPPVCHANNHKLMQSVLQGTGRPWYNAFVMFHYSRSLEKFALKGKTWTSATGEVQKGATEESASKGYNIPTFLARNLGWTTDASALRYTCQLREHLREKTGEQIYLRPGNAWYRNAEFGKLVSDPDKRGRYGRENPEGFRYADRNPYVYHGKALGDYSKFFYNGSSRERIHRNLRRR